MRCDDKKIIFENCNDLDILHIRVLKTNTPSIKIATKICNFINKNDQYRYKEYEGEINVPSQDKKFFMKYPVIHFKLFKKNYGSENRRWMYKLWNVSSKMSIWGYRRRRSRLAR